MYRVCMKIRENRNLLRVPTILQRQMVNVGVLKKICFYVKSSILERGRRALGLFTLTLFTSSRCFSVFAHVSISKRVQKRGPLSLKFCIKMHVCIKNEGTLCQTKSRLIMVNALQNFNTERYYSSCKELYYGLRVENFYLISES